MSATVSDFIVRRLIDWGVRRTFGYPGDGINGVMGALNRAQKEIELIQVRHEEMAAFMACGHAKYTGEVGVCIATSGPGAIHLLNGLYDAKADRQPVVAIVGQQPRAVLGGHYQQEVDLMSVFKDVAHEYLQMVTAPEQVRHVIDRAIRIARAERTPTCIILPADVQELPAAQPRHEHGTVHSGMGYTTPVVVPQEADLRRAAEVLNAGKRVAMLVGAGAAGAGAQVLAVADKLGAGIAKSLLGKTVVADELPQVTGGIGLLGSKATHEMMSGCDTLLMVGSSFPYAEFLPREGHARGVQIDIDGRMLGLRYPMELNLVGDSARTLELLLPMLQQKQDRGWRENIEKNVATWWETLEKRAMLEARPVNPQRVIWELSPRLPADTVIACDTGASVFWYARDLKLAPTMKAAHSGSLASMGAAMPYALAAKFAYPERPVFAFIGDGAMQMNGINEMITLAAQWRRWKDPKFIVVVFNNHDLNMVSWEQRIEVGDPKFSTSQDLPRFSYARYAEQLGLRGLLIDTPEAISDVWDQAFASDRPVIVEALTDPDVPLLPPHITVKQARHYLAALAKGDPDAGGIVKSSLKELFTW
ncbi:MAG: poxB [Betaproteobacteria bacterium]|nr:poxB [Betaproteobacteria bacterium]